MLWCSLKSFAEALLTGARSMCSLGVRNIYLTLTLFLTYGFHCQAVCQFVCRVNGISFINEEQF